MKSEKSVRFEEEKPEEKPAPEPAKPAAAAKPAEKNNDFLSSYQKKKEALVKGQAPATSSGPTPSILQKNSLFDDDDDDDELFKKK